MNGISLAALLGAAGWLGDRLMAAADRDDDKEMDAGKPERRATPVAPAAEIADAAGDRELYWPSGSMFQ